MVKKGEPGVWERDEAWKNNPLKLKKMPHSRQYPVG
jgi:hypothetical protein